MTVNSAGAVEESWILYEDNHVLAVNKPCGEPVQEDGSGDPSVLSRGKDFLKHRDGKPGNVFLGLPHRLDRPSSGVLILAKTSKALTRLCAAFRNRETLKQYWAIVESPPPHPSGELYDWLLKNGRTNKSHSVPPRTPGAKEARLSYRLVGALERYWLLEIDLHTGRHHQIRAQLAAMGSSIKGDVKYGARRPNPGGCIHLHARHLVISHPVLGEPLRVTSPPPSDSLWEAFIGKGK